MKGVSESLAGRAAVMDFEGLSGLELLSSRKIEPDTNGINQMLLRGGFPELWQDVSRPLELYLDSYIATYLERDVKQVLAVGNLRDFERFLRACALRSAQQLNKSELARDVGISVTTAGEWLSVLEALGQVYLLEPWFGNLTKRLVKSPKLYLAEPALMGYLCGIRQDTLSQSPFVGAYWETLVYAELRKQLAFRGLKPRLWYYRDQSQNEADFILEDGHHLHLYECKWTSAPNRAMASNLDKIEKIFSESSSSFKVTGKSLITRAAENFTSDGLTYASIFHGLLEKEAGVE
jgi:predicted AAA+ superfamily ATPase